MRKVLFFFFKKNSFILILGYKNCFSLLPPIVFLVILLLFKIHSALVFTKVHKNFISNCSLHIEFTRVCGLKHYLLLFQKSHSTNFVQRVLCMPHNPNLPPE